MRLSKPIEKQGFFWLPDRAEKTFPGILRISRSAEITLRLVYLGGNKADLQFLYSGTPVGSRPSRILGLIGHEPVTLEGCFAYDDPLFPMRFETKTVSSSFFHVDRAFLGVNFEEETVNLSKFDFSVDGLSDWLSISGFRDQPKTSSGKAEWSITYIQPDDIPFHVTDDIKLSFIFSPSYSTDYNTESAISQKPYVSLSSQNLISLDKWENLAHRIHVFLCLAMGQARSINHIQCFSSQHLNGRGKQKPIQFFREGYLNSSKHKNAEPIVLNYKDLQDKLEDVMRKWFDICESTHPAFELYLSSATGAHKCIDAIFLSLAQGIETLHRRLYQDKPMDEKDFRNIQEKMLEVVPECNRAFIRAKLQHLNEFTLKSRLTRLIDPFRKFFGEESHRNRLVRNIVDMRNYLTHYDKGMERRTKSISVEELVDICRKIEALFLLHFLSVIDMDPKFIEHTAQENITLQRKLAPQDLAS